MASDSGVAGLVLVSVIAIVAFAALSAFLNGYLSDAKLARAKSTSASAGLFVPALLTYYNTQTPTHTIPCPDTTATPDGVADTCAGPGTTTGVLPWVTLGTSRDDAIDAHGNFFTYVVSTVGKNICATVTTDLAGSTPTSTYTGDLLDPTDLTLVDASGASRNVPFAIISHGANGRGATTASGTQAASPVGTFEIANAAMAPSTIYAGPYSEDAATYFDDQVTAPSNAALRETCGSLTPGGALNADVSDNFNSGAVGIDAAKFDAVGVTKAVDVASPGNRVANFADNNAYLSTDAAYNFKPTVRSVYTAAYWTPNVGGSETHGGISIVTRATLTELAAGTDDFTGGSQRGITFRFYQQVATNISNGTGTTNVISIRDDGAEAVNSGADTYQLINGESYYIEAYDNGSDVWMRITQRDDVANTATLRTTNATDLTGDQRVVFINDIGTSGGSSVSYLDDLIIGSPMLALETGPNAGYAGTTGENNDNGTATGNLSLEAWIRPKSLPAIGARATVISKWDTANASTSAFRLFLNGDNEAQLTLSLDDVMGVDDAESFNLGVTPKVDEWAHVAVTYEASTRGIRVYLGGVLVRAITSGLDVTGVKAASQEFIVGAQQTSDVAVDFFHGNISDVRVWNDVRTADEIEDNFSRRLSVAGTEANLVVNWVFDRESGTVGGTQDVQAVPSATGVDGVLTGATYSPLLATYYRPISTSFCPAGTIAGAYQCDFRTASASGFTDDITVPSNLTAIYAKVWGAGGGGLDGVTGTDDTGGGSGGFSEGLIQSINGATIAGQVLDVYAGGYGTGSATLAAAGGGGGGSGIYTISGIAGLVAGGGGGASRSNRNVAGAGNCNTAVFTARCGLGGNGGGAGALTTRAPSEGVTCGGRGGDNSPTGANPPTAADCDDGGGDSVVRTGGGGASGGQGGGPTFLAGGRGYNAIEADGAIPANATGGGGGGGGAIGGEAGGYRDATARSGNGGGGGSGTAGAGVLFASGAVGSYNAQFSNATRTGDKTTGSPVIIGITPDLSTANWQAGYSITGTGIPANATILSIDSNTQITMSANATNGTVVTLTVTNVPSSIPGGNTDFHYSPSYLNSTLRTPGLGGTVGALVNGRGGAVVLLW